jgi:hypothetical protein
MDDPNLFALAPEGEGSAASPSSFVASNGTDSFDVDQDNISASQAVATLEAIDHELALTSTESFRLDVTMRIVIVETISMLGALKDLEDEENNSILDSTCRMAKGKKSWFSSVMRGV